ncbi:aminotransferase class I/II-fold pyridoxal phosphate-dependent enzyme [Flavisphingomonas formosensis]|uniref:aminotransferase class I/II-fold pyridoxal phosphate-dependent enzyme n=1 Tax=Flavisphingomonas formosensis TaxID=861534 RepID=UPI0012FB81F5|nr:aminotransferase class I/II-fold pyridoxal phosphate-dependent enzyme [Sphingomonas formosensis]
MREWTFHGGRIGQARQVYGHPQAAWLDLSTGINPHSWPGAGAVAVDWRALPDEQALADLEAAAAARFGADPAFVCALPGTEIGLRLLGTVLPPGGAHVAPAYRSHADALTDGRGIAPEHMEQAVRAGASLLLANPNNPDGRITPPERLHALLRDLAPGRHLIVDEAFADAQPEISLAGHVGDGVPLVLFRSFGKYFGLAGVRLGFVLAPRPIIAAYRARLGSWPVSAAAIAIGAAAYRDARWIDAMRTRLAEDAARLDALLARHGYAATGASPLFRLIRTPDAAVLFDRLARAAILTRPFDHDPDVLRFGLPGSEAAFARLDRALADG